MGDEGRMLRQRLLATFRQPIDTPLPDHVFNDLALAVFGWQFERNPAFAAFCRNRGRTPGSVVHWTEVPAVPTAAFKHVALVAGDPAGAEAVFRTSGTTLGGARRGAHYLLDLSLYHGSLLPSFQAYLLPDGARPVMLSLMPPPAELPDSSLAHMIGVVIDKLGPPGSGSFATVTGGLDAASLETALRSCAERHQPVCLLGTSFAFLHWLDQLERRGERLALPAGSRLMDTGGYKASARTVPPAEMLARYQEFLGIPADWCVNEYGMTELCSQHYDARLRDHVLGRTSRALRKVPPPWLRTRVTDPETLAPVPPGAEGLLQHFDLANLGSVLAVQTEDVGVEVEDGVRLIGRVLGAQPRGCSIAMDDLLRAAGRTPSENP
jgi:hypothetical protein